MKHRINGGWDELRMNGILAWIHRLVMFITFPLRRFWLFLMICLAVFAVLLIIPLYLGVPFNEIGVWYRSGAPMQKWSEVKDKALAEANVKFEAVENTVAEMSDKIKGKTVRYAQTADNEKVQLVSWPVAEFKRAQYHPKKSAVKTDGESVVQKESTESFSALKPPPMNAVLSGQAQKVEEKRRESHQEQKPMFLPPHTLFYEGKLSDYYERLEHRGLIYVQEPDILYGKAEVSSANSMSINGTFFFLYGIYTDSNRQNPLAAERYLRDITAENPVYCAVVAYAANTQTPTALCFVNGIFINRSMVNHNLADNVGLK
ncbi:MAG: hypothetical protein IKR92_04120 [Alphaproteobacteria bacterium]|nr:hypothetical protein [Alphaproteobacteria bacterium]